MDKFKLKDRFRARNYDLCRAIDLTKLGIVCDTLIRCGANSKDVSRLKSNADNTLQLLRSINEGLEKDKS